MKVKKFLWNLFLNQPVLGAIAVGIIVFAAGIAIDSAILGEQRRMLYSDFFAGFVAGLFAHGLSRICRERAQLVSERLNIITETNHHVRNALTAVTLSAHITRHPEHVRTVRKAVARIDWALREVLTGKMERGVSNPAEDSRQLP